MSAWRTTIRAPDRTLRSERGSVLIMVAVSLVAILAIAAISIDAAVMMTTKTQLQNAADAAALAAASGLIASADPAVATQRAVAFAGYNFAVQDSRRSPVVISAADVAFPEPDVVRVTTHRTRATGDPLQLFFGRVIDAASDNRADLTAVAAAAAYDVCSTHCMKPWAVPDRWDDADGDGEYDEGELYDPQITGYQAPLDIGTQVTLKVSNPNQTLTSGLFYPVDYPPLGGTSAPLTGGDWYREWIGDCEPFLVGIGDQLQVEPGNMVGPTRQGMDELIARDPTASWDTATNTIVNSAFAESPRIALVPLFDPTIAPEPGRNWVTVTQIGAFFIDQTGPGGQVTGRFLDYTTPGVPCPGGLGRGLVKGLSLVE